MSEQVDRRRFLGGAALLATGAACPRSAAAIEPIERNGAAKFKFSLSAYSYRSLLTGHPPQLSLDDFLADCARFGLEGAEPTTYYFPKEITREYLCRLKGLAFRLGLDISGTAVGNDFAHPPGAKRDQQIAHVKRWIEHAEVLGVPVIRIFSGRARDGQTPDKARRLAIEAIEECCDYAGGHGVFLALENHGGLTTTADEMLKIIRDVKSPWFGVNLDSGNFHSDDVYGELARIAPYALNVQVKVVVSGPDRKKVPSDFDRLAKILTGTGYRGYIVLEYEEREILRESCPRFIEQLRQAFT